MSPDFGFHENHVFAFLGIEKDFAFVCPTNHNSTCQLFLLDILDQTSVIRFTGTVCAASSLFMEAKIEVLKKAADATTLVGTKNSVHPEFQIC